MAFKQIRDSLPWLVPSAAIVIAASGGLDELNLFNQDEPAPVVAVAPQAVQPALQSQPQPVQQPLLEGAPVTRQDTSALSLAATTPSVQTQVAPEPVISADAATAAALANAVQAPRAAPAAQTERQASLTTTPTFTTSFATAAQNRCVEDLRSLTAEARVYFPSGGLTADEGGIEQGRLIGVIAQSCPGVKILVEGHSDPSGDPTANLKLSEERAAYVIQRIGAGGIGTDVFVARGFGDQRPSGIVGPEPSWYYDRRVQFSILEETQNVAFTTTAAPSPWAGSACVEELERATSSTALFYNPGSVSVKPGDLETAMGLAEMAMQCPGARLRVIGHHTSDISAREDVATGILRAKALMAMMVGRGATSDEIIIAAPSRASGGLADNGLPGSRVNFDIILEDG